MHTTGQLERIETTQAPASLPISIAELRDYLRLGAANDAFDVQLGIIIEAVTDYAQRYTGQRFVTQTVRQWLGHFPRWGTLGSLSALHRFSDYGRAECGCPPIKFFATPVQSITALVWYDRDGTATTIPSTDYHVSPGTSAVAATITPIAGASWPLSERCPDGVAITAIVGYGDPYDVPAAIRHALLQIAAHQFAAGGCASASAKAIGADAMLDPFRRVRLTHAN